MVFKRKYGKLDKQSLAKHKAAAEFAALTKGDDVSQSPAACSEKPLSSWSKPSPSKKQHQETQQATSTMEPSADNIAALVSMGICDVETAKRYLKVSAIIFASRLKLTVMLTDCISRPRTTVSSKQQPPYSMARTLPLWRLPLAGTIVSGMQTEMAIKTMIPIAIFDLLAPVPLPHVGLHLQDHSDTLAQKHRRMKTLRLQWLPHKEIFATQSKRWV